MIAYAEYAYLFKAMADGTRLEILDMLIGGQLCACKILERFNITQPTLSYHMKILTESGLVTGVRDGAWMRYSLSEERMAELQSFLGRFKTGEARRDDGCCCGEE